eukprot:COSAG01_NODE_12643_length_1705_cov_1.159402_2_plen_119_part_00
MPNCVCMSVCVSACSALLTLPSTSADLRTVPDGVGGETHFPTLGLSIKPLQGRLLMWDNVDADGRLLPDSVHVAMPLLGDRKEAEGISLIDQNEKWVFNLWFRGSGAGAGACTTTDEL